MSYYSHPSRPHVSIPQPQIPHGALPPGAQRPINPSPSTRSYTPWAFEVTPPAYPEEQFGSLQNPWEDGAESPDTLRHRTLSLSNLPSAPRSPSRAASFQPGMSSAPVAFPEPHIYRSASQRPVGHKPSKSDASSPSLMLQRDTSTTSFQSTHSWYYDDDDAYGSASNEVRGLYSSTLTWLTQLSSLTEKMIVYPKISQISRMLLTIPHFALAANFLAG